MFIDPPLLVTRRIFVGYLLLVTQHHLTVNIWLFVFMQTHKSASPEQQGVTSAAMWAPPSPGSNCHRPALRRRTVNASDF
mmetsp:Transcript_16553/g.30539  ORF Transcript_16553/g.30539 Transcript_16553/m.30539 type:complete len:80 (+) Transcript_16553:172-411(+)